MARSKTPPAAQCARSSPSNRASTKTSAKRITKDIKDTKLKVQPQFMENKIRVSGKKIDDLQAVIAKLKENDYGIALQFNNFRS